MTKLLLAASLLCLVMITIPFRFAFADARAAEWTLFADDAKGEEGAQVSSFTPSDHRQHFRAKMSDVVPIDTKVRWIFTAVETESARDKKLTQIEMTVDKTGAKTLNATASLPEDWPVGKYRVDLLLDGNEAGSYEYIVMRPHQ